MDPSKPCIWYTDKESGMPLGKMRSISTCTKDEFSMALVNLNPPKSTDPEKQRHTASYQGTGDGNDDSLGGSGYMAFSKSVHAPDVLLHVAVVRSSDGKQVTPKALMPDGKLVDISATKKRVCLLFEKGTNKLAVFRMGLSLDGTRVTGNDFARAKTLADMSPKGLPGVPCGQYFENGPPAVEGRMMDAYAPVGTCQVVIDDCSK
jgi:hypothetical protein